MRNDTRNFLGMPMCNRHVALSLDLSNKSAI